MIDILSADLLGAIAAEVSSATGLPTTATATPAPSAVGAGALTAALTGIDSTGQTLTVVVRAYALADAQIVAGAYACELTPATSQGSLVWSTTLSLPATAPTPSNASLVFVGSLDDLPPAVDGAISLPDNSTYLFTTDVDLLGAGLNPGRNVAILGTSSENASITSNGLSGRALIVHRGGSLPMRNIRLTSPSAPVFDLDGLGENDAAIDWAAVNVVDSPDMGSIADYTNVIIERSAFLSSAGLELPASGTLGTFGFVDSIWVVPEGLVGLTVKSGFTFSRRLRVDGSPFVVLGGATGIVIEDPASLPAEGLVIQNSPQSGPGTYLSGVAYNDPEADFRDSAPLADSAAVATYSMLANATATTITSTGVFVKVAGTTTPGARLSRFTVDIANEAIYTGVLPKLVKVTALGSLSGSANKVIQLRIAVDGVTLAESTSPITLNSGGRVEGASCQAILEVVNGSAISVFVANTTDTSNVTAEYLSVTISGA